MIMISKFTELVSSAVSSSRIEQRDIRMDILGQSTEAAAPCPVSYVAPPVDADTVLETMTGPLG